MFTFDGHFTSSRNLISFERPQFDCQINKLMWVKPFRQSKIWYHLFLSAYKLKPLYLFHLMNLVKALKKNVEGNYDKAIHVKKKKKVKDFVMMLNLSNLPYIFCARCNVHVFSVYSTAQKRSTSEVI